MRGGRIGSSGSTLLICAMAAWLAGCRNPRPAHLAATLPTTIPGLSSISVNDELDARVMPPLGWRAEPLKSSARHKHQVWLSPSGNTAYGLIKFNLPLPVGHDIVLWGFLNEMRRTEGEATLVKKEWDADLDGLRFVAQGGLYLVRTNLFVHGFSGWAIYAGTLRAQRVDEDELKLAELAREKTRIGRTAEEN